MAHPRRASAPLTPASRRPARLRGAALAGLALLASLSPASAERFEVPAKCKAFLTVQLRGCQVSHFYRCGADPAGTLWRVDLDHDGPFFRSQIDAEAQWIYSEQLVDNYVLRLLPNPSDPASLSGLLATGHDSYDFQRRLEGGGAVLRVKGYDRLTGKSTTIDGVSLEETDFAYQESGPDGAVLLQAQGQEYVHRGWRLFFSGRYQVEGRLVDRSPMRFDEPGDPGFLGASPEYDCGGEMAGLGTASLPPPIPADTPLSAVTAAQTAGQASQAHVLAASAAPETSDLSPYAALTRAPLAGRAAAPQRN